MGHLYHLFTQENNANSGLTVIDGAPAWMSRAQLDERNRNIDTRSMPAEEVSNSDE